MGIYIGIGVMLIGSVGLLGLASLWGWLSQSWALVILFNLFQLATIPSLHLFDAFNRLTGGPLNPDRHAAGGIVFVWMTFSVLAAMLLRQACLHFAAFLHGAGVRPSIPPERPVARLAASLRQLPRKEIMQRVQGEYLVPEGLVSELIQR